MTKRIKAVPLKGGPSDGQEFRSTTRWPLYLTPAGEMLDAQVGDRIMNGRSARKACYVAQRSIQTAKVTHYEYREIES